MERPDLPERMVSVRKVNPLSVWDNLVRDVGRHFSLVVFRALCPLREEGDPCTGMTGDPGFRLGSLS